MKKTAWMTAVALSVVLSACLGGCGDGAKPSLYSRLQAEDPHVRIEAMTEAARQKDPEAVPYLVESLGSSEADLRMFASVALRDLTGQTFGYNHYDPPAERAVAIERWRQWLRAGRPTPPASAPVETVPP